MVGDFDKALKALPISPRCLRGGGGAAAAAAAAAGGCLSGVQRESGQRAAQEVGDFENWMKTMEWDMQSVATALENAAALHAGGGGGGGGPAVVPGGVLNPGERPPPPQK